MCSSDLRQFGIVIHEKSNGFHIPGGQKYLSIAKEPQVPYCQLSIDTDWSNAAFWLAANALGSDVRVTGLCANSAQPDSVIAALLKALPGEIDVSQCPDLMPILAAVLALTPGERKIVNAARLRLKESDRLHAMAQNLSALGADIIEQPDGLIIQGKPALHGGTADSFGDHRIAMAIAIAALRCESGVTLHGAQAVQKSYPAFWEDYRSLGGTL